MKISVPVSTEKAIQFIKEQNFCHLIMKDPENPDFPHSITMAYACGKDVDGNDTMYISLMSGKKLAGVLANPKVRTTVHTEPEGEDGDWSESACNGELKRVTTTEGNNLAIEYMVKKFKLDENIVGMLKGMVETSPEESIIFGLNLAETTGRTAE